MTKVYTWIVMLAVILVVWAYRQLPPEDLVYSDASRHASSDELDVGDVQKGRVRSPGPLIVSTDSSREFLTEGGIIKWTNSQRQKHGLTQLSTNDLLTQAAMKKIDDMFEGQYFEHESPDGVNVGELIASVGYGYITVGENLAKGGFDDDEALVGAWMDSPGHRENILDAAYTEIGVAVKRGMFDGQEVWLAVQEFGLPASACPWVDYALGETITEDKALYEQLEVQIRDLESQMDELREDPEKYNEKVGVYNSLVEQINPIADRLKANIAVYNARVEEVNSCIERYTGE